MTKKKSATKKPIMDAGVALAKPERGLLSAAFWKSIFTSKWFAPLFFLAITLFYFLPIIIRLTTYMPGGDAMYNAWVIARNHHCILRENCDDYTTANQYFPHEDTMLYSETELSPSVVTLPVRLFTDNPIAAYNLITIASFFMIGLSMYLLARHLSKGNQFFALAAGVVFEFAPIIMASTHHLQNLSIFCLPLAVLFILKYVESRQRKYLLYLFLALLYVFYASWYQMVFVSGTIGLLLLGLLWVKRQNFRQLCMVVLVLVAACVATLPLAKEYMRFSKESGAEYELQEKVANSSSFVDYVVPTPVTSFGEFFGDQRFNFSLDTWSYAGISMYVIAFGGLWLVFKNRKKIAAATTKLYVTFFGVGALAFIISFGPFLKFNGSHLYNVAGQGVSIPMPYLWIDQYVPVLGFMRQPARASMLFIFALCCLLALLPILLKNVQFFKKRARLVYMVLGAVLIIDFVPLTMVPLDPHPHAYHPEVPKVYQYIKKNPEIDNIIILQAKEYPNVSFWFARTENVLWAGYHNRNIYNGYSGYIPPTYEAEYSDFVNLDADDPAQMKRLGLRYVIVDSELYTNKPEVLKKVPDILGDKPVYSDSRYKIYKLE